MQKSISSSQHAKGLIGGAVNEILIAEPDRLVVTPEAENQFSVWCVVLTPASGKTPLPQLPNVPPVKLPKVCESLLQPKQASVPLCIKLTNSALNDLMTILG